MADSYMQTLLAANDSYVKSGQHKPLPIGVSKKLVVVTCMDSRIIPEHLLGLQLHDAEIIRNGGGRVTEDVMRSMILCQDLLNCEKVLIIHHTDCGGQHALFCGTALFENAKHKAQELLGTTTEGTDMKPILSLEESVREDVELMRKDRRIKESTSIYGLILDTATGKLSEVCRDVRPAADP